MNVEDVNKTYHPGIFIMMKYPQAGQVKSRLAHTIGYEAAADLYRTFIQDILATVSSLEIPFLIAAYSPPHYAQLVQWLGSDYEYLLQHGRDLGERLQNGFTDMFKNGFQQVIALASDCPDLPPKYLQTAVSSLQTHDAVIGPSLDGGYYLIGFTIDHFVPGAFESITWSTETVFRETLSRIESATQRVYVLPEWPDIDNKTDLQTFYTTNQSPALSSSFTMKYLLHHPGLLHLLF